MKIRQYSESLLFAASLMLVLHCLFAEPGSPSPFVSLCPHLGMPGWETRAQPLRGVCTRTKATWKLGVPCDLGGNITTVGAGLVLIGVIKASCPRSLWARPALTIEYSWSRQQDAQTYQKALLSP